MESDWFLKLALLFGFLILSAFFSGSEVALFSIDKNKIKELKGQNSFFANYIMDLLEFPRRLLVTILLGNTIVNVAATIISVTLALDIARLYQISEDVVLASQIIIVTVMVLLIGEIIPKIWASKHPISFSKLVCFPLYWISVIVYPVAKTLTDLLKLFASRIRLDKTKTAMLGAEIAELANLGIEKGTIEQEEHGLIHGLVTFQSVLVREVMTPRVDIKAVSIFTEFDELMKLITETMHSRIPLYGENLDEILGIIYAKDLLPYLKDNEKKKTLKLDKIARKAMFVPETKLISNLLKEFQEKKMHIGIVVDEYGGTAGLVSLEDILEEIVGEIRDEYDIEENEITKIDEKSFLILGKTSIDEVNQLLNVNLYSENDDYDTIGGFILNFSGSIPNEGYSFDFENYKFTVKEIIQRRVTKVLVTEANSIDQKTI